MLLDSNGNTIFAAVTNPNAHFTTLPFSGQSDPHSMYVLARSSLRGVTSWPESAIQEPEQLLVSHRSWRKVGALEHGGRSGGEVVIYPRIGLLSVGFTSVRVSDDYLNIPVYSQTRGHQQRRALLPRGPS